MQTPSDERGGASPGEVRAVQFIGGPADGYAARFHELPHRVSIKVGLDDTSSGWYEYRYDGEAYQYHGPAPDGTNP